MKTFRKLQEEYRKNGISLIYGRSKKYYLSLINVPYTVEGIEHKQGECQLTGYLVVYSKVAINDIESMTKEVYDNYKRKYADNKIMLSYVS